MRALAGALGVAAEDMFVRSSTCAAPDVHSDAASATVTVGTAGATAGAGSAGSRRRLSTTLPAVVIGGSRFQSTAGGAADSAGAGGGASADTVRAAQDAVVNTGVHLAQEIDVQTKDATDTGSDVDADADADADADTKGGSAVSTRSAVVEMSVSFLVMFCLFA